MKAGQHPARDLLDHGQNINVKSWEVTLDGADSRSDWFRILRTNEQTALQNMLERTGGALGTAQNGWRNLNIDNARALDKYIQDLERWGGRLREVTDFVIEFVEE